MRRAAWAILVLLCGCGQSAPAEAPLRVAAAASLVDLLDRLRPAWEAAHPGTRLEVVPGASSSLARQVLEGSAVDVFLSADRESLARAGERVRGRTERAIWTNRLAAVGEGTPDEAALRGSTVAICGAEVPAGKSWRAWLAGRGIAGAERWPQAENVRSALALFESGAVDVALVYATDAAACRRAHGTWIPDDAPASVYWGAAVSEKSAAREFLDWLGSEESRRTARSLGFGEVVR